MKVFVEGNRIKIRREGIFLCLDGSQPGNLTERLARFVNVQCEDFDIPFKMGFLSWPQEFTSLPDNKVITSHNLSGRGRFITPLVESIFPELNEKDLDLLLVSSGTVYDWGDWEGEIRSRFKQVYTYEAEKLESMTQVELEELLLQDVFNFKIDEVLLYSEDSLLYDLPEEFKLRVDQGRFIYSIACGSRYENIGFKTCGPHQEANVKVNVCNTDITLTIKTTHPELTPIDRPLQDSQLFLSSLESYQKEIFEHDCPLCHGKHKFPRAFICMSKKSDDRVSFGPKWRVIFNNVELERRTDSRFAVFQPRGNAVFFHISRKPVVHLLDEEFIVTSEDNRLYRVKVSDGMRVSELEEIHSGLFYCPDNIYVLSLRQ